MSREDKDDAAWSKPPTPLAGDDELYVDFRFTVKAMNKIDTVGGTAFMQFDITMYWTDSRLANWADGADLPPALWTPRFDWHNTEGGDSSEFLKPTLLEPKTGRVRMRQSLTGSVVIRMDLHAFPFDIERVMAGLRTGIHSRSADDSNHAVCNSDRLYCVRKIQDPNEGSWLNVSQYSGKVDEWTLHGVSTEIAHQKANSTGQRKTEVMLSFHVARGASYYFWKALFPLYLVTILSFATFEFEVTDLGSRTGTTSTYFLAAFAMLYVIDSSLPKTDFLTNIDWAIILTTSCLVIGGIVSVVLHRIAKDDEDKAEKWNTIIEIALAAVYVLGNLGIILPAAIRSWRQVKQLTAKEPGSAGAAQSAFTAEVDVGGGFTAGGAVSKLSRPLVRPNAQYSRWVDIKKSAADSIHNIF